MQAEYAATKLDILRSRSNNFDGYYIQANYTLTGEARPYDVSSGSFGIINPNEAFSLKNGTWGAFEIAARYNYIDLNSRTIKAGTMENYTVGLNWYLNNNIATSLAATSVKTDKHAVKPNNKPNLIMLRTQVLL